MRIPAPRRLACLLLLALAGLPALAPAEDPGISCEPIGRYSVDRLNQVLTTERAEFCDYPQTYPPARCAVTLYRITYPSVIPELANQSTAATGLLAVPELSAAEASKPLPVVSYQHGTVFSKTEVPSHPDESMETRLMLAQFAGQGYVVIAADYFGKGGSPEPDSYLVKGSTQQACLDLMLAARKASGDLHVKWGPLFLSGWSQGGWATLVFLNKLESVGIPVTAAATTSAPTDLFALINRWIHAPEAGDASFLPGLLALQIPAYEHYHQLPGLAAEVIRPEYLATVRDLFANKLTWAEAAPKLPGRVADLLRPEFIAEGALGAGRYWQVLQDSQAYRWRTRTPLRSYYGEVDEVVPAFIALLPVAYQKFLHGAATTGIEVTGAKATHRSAFLHAVADQKLWFDQLANP
jgi:hypothetical protein